MEGVEEVRQQGEKRLFWRAKIGGKTKEWESELQNRFLINRSHGKISMEVRTLEA
jgi:hypothetical protein